MIVEILLLALVLCAAFIIIALKSFQKYIWQLNPREMVAVATAQVGNELEARFDAYLGKEGTIEIIGARFAQGAAASFQKPNSNSPPSPGLGSMQSQTMALIPEEYQGMANLAMTFLGNGNSGRGSGESSGGGNAGGWS